ncbi:MAG: DUF4384 domain-containing protein [Bacteroidales bacterium]|nr:DUF4384 domain-containing protein [Bacteroidales bacterium]
MKRAIIILILVSGFIGASAQLPQWTNENTREQMYPLEKFYRGYATQIIDRNKDIQEAKDETLIAAKANLSQSISTTVKSKEEMIKRELVKNTENNKLNFNYNSEFDSRTLTISEHDLSDMQQMEPVYDKKENKVYAFVYIEKNKFLLKNQNLIDMSLLTIKSAIQNAESYIEQSRELDALELLVKTDGVFNKIEEAQSLVFSISDQMYKLEEYLNQRNSVFNLVKKIENSTDLSINEACKLVVDDLKKQTYSRLNQVIELKYIKFENGKHQSSFSRRFSKELGHQLSINNFHLASGETDFAKMNEYVQVSGVYYIEGNVIRIYISMIGKPTGKEFASASGLVSKNWLENNDIEYVPVEVIESKERFTNREPLLEESHYGGIELSFWTNKLVSNPVFEEGESMKLYIQVNKPCYVRGLYFQADELTTHPFQDFYVSVDKVGQILDLQEMKIADFVMGAPYGGEHLLIAVSEKPFIDLTIEVREVMVDGSRYDLHVITDDDFTAISTTKGLINKLDSEETEKSSYYAQKSISLKVVPKKE